MLKEIRHTGSFVAVGEDGTEQTIHIYTHIIDAGTRANPYAELQGLKELRTEDGGAVNRIEKGKYQVVQTDEILTSDDPNAP
jgi:hypothetical protein